jgi:hypothetical protein
LGKSNLYMTIYGDLTVVSWEIFITGTASIHLVNVSMVTNKNLKPPSAWAESHGVDSPNCEGSGEIDRLKRICMLYSLLLKKLAIPAFGDDLHHVILGCGPVETKSEGFPDDRML